MDRLTTDQQALAAESFTPTTDIARRYARLFPAHAEDIESSATWGAVRAAASWRPDRGSQWSRWLELCVKSEIREFLGGAHVRRKTPLEIREDDRVTEGQDQDEPDTDGPAGALEAMIEKLPDRSKTICLLVYRDGKSPSEAGESLGFSGFHGRRLHKEALDILRTRLSA